MNDEGLDFNSQEPGGKFRQLFDSLIKRHD
jgi:hypothetical protein